MGNLLTLASVVEILLFGALAVIAGRTWRARRDEASLWFALTTGVLAVVIAAGLVVDDGGGSATWALKAEIALLAVFPYCLYRFMHAFAEPSPRTHRVVAAGTAVVVVLTMLLPSIPEEGSPRPWWFVAYIVVFLAHWTVVSLLVAGHFWLAGRDQPAVARRRMRLLSVASVALTAALLVSGTLGDEADEVAVVVQVLAIGAAVLFFLGYAPPRTLRVVWSRPDSEALRRSVARLMAATTEDDVVRAILPNVAGALGSTRAALVHRDGRVLGSIGLTEDEVRAAAREPRAPGTAAAGQGSAGLVTFSYPMGVFVVAATARSPVIGREERDLVDAVATLTEIALDRAAEATRQRQDRDRLERLNALKNEFVAMVAHDLRSPMVVVAGYADMLVDRGDAFSPEQRAEMLATISRSVKKLARLVEDVLQVARIESGEFTYEIAPFDVLSVVRGAVDDVAGAADENRLEIEAPASLPRGLGDAERHWQILTNLLSNALKFSPPSSPVRVTVSADDELRVAVEDRGPGIPEEDLDKLFLKFSRLGRNGAARGAGGTGLGLYICKSMIEAQGGAIEVRSTRGEGSTFSYTIPKAEEAA